MGNNLVKKIGIIVPSGWGIKSFLLNDFFKIITEDSKLYIFSPLSKSEEFRNLCGGKNVSFEILNIFRLNSFSSFFFDFLIYSHYYRKPTYINKTVLKRYPSGRLKGKLKKDFLKLWAKYFGKYLSFDFQIFLEKNILGFKKEVKRLREVYKREGIKLVFSTTPLISWHEHPALFAAKEAKVKTACIITSWDNLASKGRLPIKFDYYFCWSSLMKKELIECYPFIKEEQIFISGAPQFDYYFKKDFLMKKEEFFKKMGMDLSKKVLLWAAASENQYPNEDKIIEGFYNNFKNSKLFNEAQVVLRAHPIGGLRRFKSLIEKYPELLTMETNPDDPKYLNEWMPSKEDIIDLVNILYYSDIVINHCSTMTLDACAFDKPVLNLAYDIEKGSSMENYVVNCYKYDHYTCVLDFGAAKIVYSEKELFETISEYLKDSSKDREGREKLLNLQIDFKDSFSSKRIAEKLLELA